MSLYDLDDNNDMVRVDGAFVRVEGSAEARIHARTSLQLIRGEAWLDITKGVEFFDLVFAEETPDEAIESHYRQVLRAVPGLVDVEAELTKDLANAVLQIDWGANYDSTDQAKRIPITDRIRIPLEGGTET
jgi:hypothetical protein